MLTLAIFALVHKPLEGESFLELLFFIYARSFPFKVKESWHLSFNSKSKSVIIRVDDNEEYELKMDSIKSAELNEIESGDSDIFLIDSLFLRLLLCDSSKLDIPGKASNFSQIKSYLEKSLVPYKSNFDDIS